jgi:hypothetical protein
MRTAPVLSALVVAGVLMASSASAAPAPQASAAHEDARRSITFIYDAPFDGGTTTYVDLGTPEFGPGDMFLATDVPMLAHNSNRRIGVEDGTEIVVSTEHDGTVETHGTLRLRGGLVMTSGVVRHSDTPFRVPVVGGTGTYANATGQLTILREDSARKVTVIEVRLFL